MYNPLTLVFRNRALEREFQRDYFEKSLWAARAAFALALLLVAAFGILDLWVFPDDYPTVWAIRYGVACPVIAALLAFSFTRAFERRMQAALAAGVMIVAICIIAFTVVGKPPGSHLYYAGLMLVFMFTYIIGRVQVVPATWSTLVCVVVYEASLLWVQTPFTIVLNNNFFIFASVAVSMIGGYTIEFHIRRDFLQRRAAEEAAARLKALSEIGQAVSSSLDLETVLTTIISRADQVSRTDGGAIYEYDETDRKLHLRATQGLPAPLVDWLIHQPIEPRRWGPDRAGLERRAIAIPDIALDTDLEATLRERLAAHAFRAMLALPLQREHDLLGGLVLVRRSPGAFEPQTIELAQSFATQSALAIHNARLFREIEAKSRALEVASRHKSDFLANMSHELRTPLNAIIGFSEALREQMFGELNTKQQEYLGDICTSGQHLLSLINDILDLSKIEAGRMELDAATFSIPQTLQYTMALIRERATRHGVQLHLGIGEGVADYHGDERKFKQIMLNLLSNAVKFTPEGGQVSVQAACAGGRLVIAVRDSGVGITPADQAALFEPFRQVGNDRTRRAEGTGLGLALTRRFVELHGGVIWVESEPGKGSCFSFSLPPSTALAEVVPASGRQAA